MDVSEAITRRASIRHYRSEDIPQEMLIRVLSAMREAPSACNFQPWKFVVIREEAARKRVAEACSRQMFIAEAPVIIAGCGTPGQAYKRMGGYGNSVEVDLAIALDHLTLAAVAEGLGTCWIGSFDEQKVKRILDVPDPVKVVALTPLGFPAVPGKPHHRKPLDEIVCWEEWH
jgi:nitroreductase